MHYDRGFDPPGKHFLRGLCVQNEKLIEFEYFLGSANRGQHRGQPRHRWEQ